MTMWDPSISAMNAGNTYMGGDSTGQNLVGLSGLLNMFGKISGGAASYSSYASKQAADNYNATIQTQNAAAIGAQTASNEQTLRLQQAQKIGQQRANLSEANIGGPGNGTAAIAVNQSEVNANMTALSERYKGNVARTSALNSAQLDQYYAKVEGQNATTSLVSAGTGALASLTSGYNRYVQAGNF